MIKSLSKLSTKENLQTITELSLSEYDVYKFLFTCTTDNYSLYDYVLSTSSLGSTLYQLAFHNNSFIEVITENHRYSYSNLVNNLNNKTKRCY